MKSRLPIAAALLLSGIVLPAHAATIATFSDNISDFHITLGSGPTSDTLSISATVSVIFSNTNTGLGNPCLNVSGCTATLALSGISTSAATQLAGTDNQAGYTGSFSFTGLTVLPNSVFLAGTFGGGIGVANLNGSDGGQTATFQSSDQGVCAVTHTCNAVSFTTSTYWNLFTPASDAPQALSISLNSLVPVLALTGGSSGFVNSASAAGTGILSTQLAAVPEPSTMLLMGSALIGLGIFGRRRYRKQ